MEYEDLVNEFNKILNYYSWHVNNKQTRSEIMEDFNRLMLKLKSDGIFQNTLLKQFIDVSTPELIYMNGGIDIKAKLINDEIVSLDEYFNILTNKEKYRKVLFS